MGGAPATAAQEMAHEIPIRLTEWALTPSEVVVAAGSAVRFVVTNAGALPHALSVEGDGFYAESAAVGSNQTTRLEVTFTVPGVYDLFCPVAAGQHRALGQEGLLTVTGAASEDAVAPDVTPPDVVAPDAGAPAAAGEALEAEPQP